MLKYILFAAIIVLFISCDKNGAYNSSPQTSYSNSKNCNCLQTGNTERYNTITDNPFIKTSEQPVSTFSIDADGASYSNVRRFIESGTKPPVDAVRIEELLNYFHYNYTDPTGNDPIALNGEIASCPWADGHKLIRIGVKGKTIPREDLPAMNLVLLLDVSGSMADENKLSLIKPVMKEFVDQMRSADKIALVTYSSEINVVIRLCYGDEKEKIKEAIDKLSAGGSTAGHDGLMKAYDIARENFIDGGNNRVVIATDGDFNVGPSTQEEMINFIKQKREEGIYITVIGVGTGNLNDGMMEQVADNGNGNYEYLDNIEQGRKVLIEEFGKFYTVANDVKIQVVFNPLIVDSYRLIGYENRSLDSSGFKNDTTDAGEIGSGQTVTALYEIVPALNNPAEKSFTIDCRYKFPGQSTSNALSLSINDNTLNFENAGEDLRFASAVAAFAMILRDSQYKGTVNLNAVKQWAQGAMEFNPYDYKTGFLGLISKTMNVGFE